MKNQTFFQRITIVRNSSIFSNLQLSVRSASLKTIDLVKKKKSQTRIVEETSESKQKLTKCLQI